jgi:hypothetical protein
MPDHGSAYWPMDDPSGTTVNDTLGSHDGTLQNPAGIIYRVSCPPSVSGYGMGFRSNSYMTVPITQFGWGSMYQRQEFTLSMKLKWTGPTGGAFLSCFNNNTGYAIGMTSAVDEGGFSLGDPYLITFSRFGGGITRTITSSVDTPALVDYNYWDDWDGGSYVEPIKVPTWFHLVVRYDGDYKAMWINSTKIAEDTVADTISIGGGNNAAMRVNSRGTSTAITDWAEFALWHTALSDGEIEG